LSLKFIKNGEKKHPESPEKRKEWEKNWGDLRLAQRVANFIHSLPEKRISQRDLLRHFSNKRINNLKEIHDYLKFNFRINLKKEGYRNKTTVYYVVKKSSK